MVWGDLFQACCLNFDKIMCKSFGDRLTLNNSLSYALQFSRIGFEQGAILSEHEIPPLIKAIDASLHNRLNEEDLNDLEYRYQVYFTRTSTSKSRAHVKFISPDSAQGKKISHVLIKERIADEKWPYKPLAVVLKVREKTSKSFSMDTHTKAWKKFGVRPKTKARHPEKTNKKYCVYHLAHRDYTYSDEWVEKLVALIETDKI